MIRVGTFLYGYCDGHFRDSYNNKRVEAIGADWVVCREEDTKRVVLFTGDPDILEEFTKTTEHLVPEDCDDYWPDEGRRYSGLE